LKEKSAGFVDTGATSAGLTIETLDAGPGGGVVTIGVLEAGPGLGVVVITDVLAVLGDETLADERLLAPGLYSSSESSLWTPTAFFAPFLPPGVATVVTAALLPPLPLLGLPRGGIANSGLL